MKKRFFSFLAVMVCLVMLLGGCKTEDDPMDTSGVGTELPATEGTSEPQEESIQVQAYPVDLQFVEYAELKFSLEEQAPQTEPTTPETDPTETTQPETDPTETTQPETEPAETTQPETESTEPAEGREPGDEDSEDKSIGSETQDGIRPESTKPRETKAPAVGDETQMSHREQEGLGSIGNTATEPESEALLTATAFRYEIIDENGDITFALRIQVQDENNTVFRGTLVPDEKVKWKKAEASDEAEELLREKLEEQLLLAEVTWKSCVEEGVYAHSGKLTRFLVSGQTVVFTNEDATVFQVQSYDSEGTLYGVLELSNSGARVLLDDALEQTDWNAVLDLDVELTIGQNSGQAEQELLNNAKLEAYQNRLEEYKTQMEEYEAQVSSLRQTRLILGVAVLLLAAGHVAMLVWLLGKKLHAAPQTRRRRRTNQPGESADMVKSIGSVHNIGGRSGQQDSFDVVRCPAGTLAVVADGMGGLSDGDKVSQKIVATMRADSARIRPGQTDNVLCQLVAHTNQEVNRMLGTARQYKCGSTLLAVLVERDTMQWVTVGDSRIYLYRNGSLIQINREHIYCAELLERAINGKLGFGEAMRDPQIDRLSSFIGMGELKHVDIGLNRLKLCSGDRILLMSDGVFNTLSEAEIAGVIRSTPDAAGAASLLEQRVLQKHAPNQDNFTCVILEV